MSDLLLGPPSPRRGWRQALRLRQLVAAVWVASWLAIAPALLLLSRLVATDLAPLPVGPGEVPAGDVELIMLEALREAWLPLMLAALSGLVAAWAWTVLWQAGVVRWRLGADGGAVHLGRLLRPGIAAWWRYARLSLTALVALAVAAAAVWLPLGWGVVRGLAAMTERRLIAVASAGALVTVVVVIVIWLATLHGAWRLGLPERRSAVRAWLTGLGSALRRPLPSLWAWLVWVVPALLASAVVPLLGGVSPGLRGGLLLVVLGLLASFLRAFCWVGLFCSFSPESAASAAAEAASPAGGGEATREPGADNSEDVVREDQATRTPTSSVSGACPGRGSDVGDPPTREET
jgi:hypothetical protein